MPDGSQGPLPSDEQPRACAAGTGSDRRLPQVKIPVLNLDGKTIGYQIREPGKNPRFDPRGLPVGESAPYVARNIGGRYYVCEGPTDAKALAEATPTNDHSSVIGCWSASTIGPPAFWGVGSTAATFISCGDNDSEGQKFNQRLANMVGHVYPIKWPLWFKQKGDVKDWLSLEGFESFMRLVDTALAREPLVRLESPPSALKRKHATTSGLICRLIEEAGGVLAYEMSGGQRKYWCPLHDDKNDASLTANDETGAWCCWAGCGKGGPLQFLQAWKGLDRDSAKVLLRKYG